MRICNGLAVGSALWLSAAGMVATAAAPAIRLSVDLRDAPRHRFEVHEQIPVQEGLLRLVYPKWIPGEHGPTGPLIGVTGMRFHTGGHELEWRRDPLDMHTVQLEVPPGTDTLELDFQFLPALDGQFGGGASTTPALAELEWNQVIWYPEGQRADALQVQADLTLPAGWQFATALEPEAARPVDGAADRARFRPVSLETLVDSPLFCGRFSRVLELSPGAAQPERLTVFADDAAALELRSDQERALRALAVQTGRLTGTRHYHHYDLLLGLSDQTAHFGLEHHQSSDNRLDLDYFTNPDTWLASAALLPHEWFHSWNGKFRRPAGLTTPDYQQPMDGRLLWVYEGLTNYYGEVLAARAGLMSAADWREQVALTAANLGAQTGRSWRPLQDTATAAQLLYDAPQAYANWRRQVDFYAEGSLIWLSVDVELRRRSGGRRSLDDFVRAFLGLHPGSVEVLSYEFDDVVAALQAVAPADWAARLQAQLDAKSPQPPLEGIRAGGWELAWDDQPGPLFKATEKASKTINAAFDLGLVIDANKEKGSPGKILDVTWGGPAFRAGIAPGMQLVAVDGAAYTPELLRRAVAKAVAAGSAPLALLVREGDTFQTIAVDYHGGLRYPHLVRRQTGPDLLEGISQAR